MRIALVGTRGVPARYGGFETAVEEIGRRLVDRGHEVVVYCRGANAPRPADHLGMELVHLPAARKKSLETLSHTALSALHMLTRRDRFDAAIVFNAANALFVPWLRLRRLPVAVHVDGLEWKRAKWSGAGQRYYQLAERWSVRWADALIADAVGIADYYWDKFGVPTELLSYGAPIQDDPPADRLADLNLTPDQYHLVVARFEPENHVLEIVKGYAASGAELPLVVVGSAPYADAYTEQIRGVAAGDHRIRMAGAVWDQVELDQLYAHALTYIHGHSVGGTNPSLLRAMGSGTAVIAFDVNFNREVVDGHGRFFGEPAELAPIIEQAERDPEEMRRLGRLLREHARARYRWDDVAAGYEKLLYRLESGESRRRGGAGGPATRERMPARRPADVHDTRGLR
jgi:glycosyltransferase involved in cell wall biosynthesis